MKNLVLPLVNTYARSHSSGWKAKCVDRRSAVGLGIAASIAVALKANLASAQQSYPDRPIKLVVPFPPGGVNDAVGRPWAERMRSLLGTVVIENLGGAGGAIGAATVAKARPDGYTLLLSNQGILVVTPIASKRPTYDPLKDFEPIFLLALSSVGFVVHPEAPFQTLTEVVAFAKANPGKLSYASAGVGTGNHLIGELFKSLTGTPDIVHVPYRGAGPELNDLVGGQIQLGTVVVTGQVLELHRAQKLRLLVVTSNERLTAAPDIPTAKEAGFPDLVLQGFHGVFAPGGTPAPIIARIAEATRVAMADRELQRFFVSSGLEPQPYSTPENARSTLHNEIARWEPVIKSIGLRWE